MSTSLHLSADQIAAAEMCGVSFLPASDAQVQRYSMQRKVFRIDGQPVLATRDGSFFETAATLERWVAEGQRQQHDLVAWQAAAAPAPPEAAVAAAVSAAPAQPPAAEHILVPVAARPTRKPRAARHPAPAVAHEFEAIVAIAPALPSVPTARRTKARSACRWVTAGAERRGREDKHWSVRRK
jgi:hypothetical protein